MVIALIACYGGGHELHVAHRIAEAVQQPFATEPSIGIREYAEMYHGGEPEPPGGPLHAAWVESRASTASSVPLTGNAAFGAVGSLDVSIATKSS